nr:uridine kinase [Ipomoea trifida]
MPPFLRVGVCIQEKLHGDSSLLRSKRVRRSSSVYAVFFPFFRYCIVAIFSNAFETEQLLECVGKLKVGQSVQVPIYDFKSHQRCSDSFRQVLFIQFCLIPFLFRFPFILSGNNDEGIRNVMVDSPPSDDFESPPVALSPRVQANPHLDDSNHGIASEDVGLHIFVSSVFTSQIWVGYILFYF